MTVSIEYEIKSGYLPGAIGRIAELHGAYYHAHWGFGLYFEAKVATERYDEKIDGLWLATINGRVEGAIAIDGLSAENEGAHLRWFIISDVLRGKSVGKELIDRAIGFCKSKAYRKIYLWTFEGLDAARYLYESSGFRLINQQSGDQWGRAVNEQYFELGIE